TARIVIGDDGYCADATCNQLLSDALHQRLAQYVERCDWRAGYALRRCARGSQPRLRHADQQYGFHIHGAHLGAAARKIAEREGIHAGMRRNREIGCIALAFWCSVNDRRYDRMICGMVMRSAAEKFCSAISIWRCGDRNRSSIFSAMLAALPVS